VGSRKTTGPTPSSHSCPQCESAKVSTELVHQDFRYGEGETSVELAVDVPVHTCGDCGFEFTDWEAEEIRHGAICDHLGLLRPSEILALRRPRSRAEFSRLTGIGEATLARWESGALLQNVSHDRYLRLLQNPGNMRQLERSRSPEPASATAWHGRFRVLQVTAAMRERAERFELRKSDALCT
jgi:DNA-binding transcriptional regulator YiaG